MLESRKAAGLAKLAGSITKLDQHDDLITKDPFWLRLALHNGTILRFPIECSILSCVASFPMCLEEQDFEYFFQLTRNLDDESYPILTGIIATSEHKNSLRLTMNYMAWYKVKSRGGAN